jgi:hypothetical protein
LPCVRDPLYRLMRSNTVSRPPASRSIQAGKPPMAACIDPPVSNPGVRVMLTTEAEKARFRLSSVKNSSRRIRPLATASRTLSRNSFMFCGVRSAVAGAARSDPQLVIQSMAMTAAKRGKSSFIGPIARLATPLCNSMPRRCCSGADGGGAQVRLADRSGTVDAPLSRHEPEARQVEEDRGGEDDAVQPVEHAAVTLDHAAPVLDAAIALDGREHQPAEKAHQAGHEG